MNYKQIQDKIIAEYRMTINEKSTCRSRTHVHIQKRTICKWEQASSVKSTFTLLHEIGHCENNNAKMRRCEEEFYATQWALDKCRELRSSASASGCPAALASSSGSALGQRTRRDFGVPSPTRQSFRSSRPSS